MDSRLVYFLAARRKVSSKKEKNPPEYVDPFHTGVLFLYPLKTSVWMPVWAPKLFLRINEKQFRKNLIYSNLIRYSYCNIHCN